MSRRDALIIIGAGLLAPGWTIAQAKIRRIGFLSGGSRPAAIESSLFGAFPQGMRELGYVEGKDFVMEWRFAEGRFDLFPGLADELVRQQVDVIVVLSSAAVPVVKKATATIPIVMVGVADPVGSGYIASLSRPGGNVTGLSGNSEIHAKQLGLLRSARPNVSRVAVLTNPRNPGHPPSVVVVRNAGAKAGIGIIEVGASTAEEIERSFATLKRERADALISFADALFFLNQRLIAELAIKHQLPWIASQSEYAASGALFSYGEPIREFIRRAAVPVDKILKGAKPAEMPVEQPNIYELVVNLRTAKALGLTIPNSVVLQANTVFR